MSKHKPTPKTDELRAKIGCDLASLNDVLESHEAIEADRNWLAVFVETIRDKADLRYGGERGLLAFAKLRDEAIKSRCPIADHPQQGEKATP